MRWLALKFGLVNPAWFLAFFFTLSFSVATQLQLWFQTWPGNRAQSTDLLNVLLGDSRRMFANHFFVEADVYFHGGYYPSIFDQTESPKTLHIAETGGDSAGHSDEDHNDMPDFLAQPKDWIERFGRNFFPTRHEHLSKPADAREILPWLMLSAELDPNNIPTYTVAAYWLRVHMGKVNEAEQFLHAGLRANPGNPEILFELGRLYEENRHDDERARNVCEAALRQFQLQSANQPEPDKLFLAKVLAHLARLEERSNHLPKTLEYLQMLLPVSANPPVIQRQIDELRQKVPAPK